MNPTDMTMGRRISTRRKEKKITQDALAQELGVTPQAVSKWENDLSCPDIAILPKLAALLGVTTDYLLSGTETPPTVEAEIVDEPEEERSGIHVETTGANHFDIHFDPPRRVSFSGAAWLIVTALLMLAGPVLKLDSNDSIGFWSACCISGLIVLGVSGMIRQIRPVNVLMTLAGVYLALSGLNVIRFDLGWEILFPGLILILGLCLLAKGFRRKQRRRSGIHITGPGHFSTSDFHVKDGYLFCSGSFSEHDYRVCADELKGGEINVSFGEHTLDFSGVEKVSEKCRLEINTSFGELELKIPSRFRAELAANKSFAEISVDGSPNPQPEGIIWIDANASFGELEITYI